MKKCDTEKHINSAQSSWQEFRDAIVNNSVQIAAALLEYIITNNNLSDNITTF